MPSALVLFTLTIAPCRGSLSAQLSGSELSFQSSNISHYRLLDVLTHVDSKAEAAPQSRDICRYDSKIHHDTLLSLIATQSYQLVCQETIVVFHCDMFLKFLFHVYVHGTMHLSLGWFGPCKSLTDALSATANFFRGQPIKQPRRLAVHREHPQWKACHLVPFCQRSGTIAYGHGDRNYTESCGLLFLWDCFHPAFA